MRRGVRVRRGGSEFGWGFLSLSRYIVFHTAYLLLYYWREPTVTKSGKYVGVLNMGLKKSRLMD